MQVMFIELGRSGPGVVPEEIEGASTKDISVLGSQLALSCADR